MLFINWKGYRFAAWVGQTLLAIAVLAAAVQGKLRSVRFRKSPNGQQVKFCQLR